MTTQQRRQTFRFPAATLGVLLLGMLIGRCTSWPDRTLAQPSPAKKSDPKTFLSGGARSEKVLREIHATLQRLDGRVANIEKLLRKRTKP